uniref:Uncharacterized protein n=1 Tax=viral metagenome TaxID=1070528 RepID=A0A6C0H8I6_9ZZZZ
MSSDRIKYNNSLVDTIITDYIYILIDKYKLQEYKYIETLEEFSLLSLRGSMKYINKFTHELKTGGLLTKIYKKNNNKWFAIIKKPNNKTYTISFNSNYIFYLDCKSRTNKIRTILDSFLENVNNGKYIIT